MLVGTANIDELARSASHIETYSPDLVHLEDVDCLQVMIEMKNQARQAVLPPSLHPTTPAALSIQAWHIKESPWGAFNLVLNRIACRSGVRARGFTTRAFVSTEIAAMALASTYGFPAHIAEIDFRRGYDGADLRVRANGNICLEIKAVNPEPMGPNDVQYTSTLNLAHTPNGLRLVQVEVNHIATRVDRLTASLIIYQGGAFGHVLLQPSEVVSASLCTETIEIPPVRFVCKVDELAFTGTEPILRA